MWLTCVCVALAVCMAVAGASTAPHIVIIMADDMGWNDMSIHGSSQIMTPNIDALGYKGVVLNRHYVQPSCSPSRSALLTGRYPVHTGMHKPLRAGTDMSLPLNHTLLPQHLAKLGYQTRLVGKWHLGCRRSEYLPTRRGYLSHFGFYNGYVDYYTALHEQGDATGIDARRNEAGAWREFTGHYITDLLTKEAVSVIDTHDVKEPLFLQVTHSAPHTGNTGTRHQVRDLGINEQEHGYIANVYRRMYAGMMRALDDSVGSILKALNSRGMLKNSIVLFMSDNGAPTVDPTTGFDNYGSNWPLRGVKMSCHEGGVRGAAIMWSPLVDGGRVSQNLIHVVDWLPTLYSAAGGDVKDLGELDGVDQWDTLRKRDTVGPRTEILVDLSPLSGNEAFISWPWKIVKYTSTNPSLNIHSGESGRGEEVPQYNVSWVTSSPGALALGLTLSQKNILALRLQANISPRCNRASVDKKILPCVDHYCLFNLLDDPYETTDLSYSNPDVVTKLEKALTAYHSSAVQVPGTNIRNPRADPAFFGNYWAPWDDTSSSNTSSSCTSKS